jgi:threonine synthase
MRYVSTRGQAPELTFEEAMLTGLARDGGLYVPAEVPVMRPATSRRCGASPTRRSRSA